uniref:Uncharacterized protein n=1 Tax=Panagrolaimus davidi TaxID=227884 RepID=A0A914Q6W9_9BILA
MDKIRNLISLENVTFQDNSNKKQDKLNILDLSLIRPPPKTHVVVQMNFSDIVAQNFDNICYPQVENLDIVGNFECSFENSKYVSSVIEKVFKVFPNLKTLKASFGNLINAPTFYRPDTPCTIILEIMESVNREMFAFIPESVKGFFGFQCAGVNNGNQNINELIAEKDGFRINEDGYIEKSFIIHDGMEFTFLAAFNEAEDSEDDASIEGDDSDADDHVMETDDEDGQAEAMVH